MLSLGIVSVLQSTNGNGSRLGWFTITPDKHSQCCFKTEINFDN